ncbi:MAG TPA: polysaccharide biosynthesis C-terminal domain-containing protein [Steroidobacteraceae bacterium]|nr:polysaccharide biosynthesis C-terminal domain-containing protein [Steroidobacteraceae bacterium]
MLSRRIFSNTTAAIADQLIGKIGTTLAFVVLVRILPVGDIATLGIATSYMVLVAYLDVGLIRILLRDYVKIAQSREMRDRHITAYFAFWGLQMVAIIAVSAVVQVLVLDGLHIPGLTLLFWALTVDFMGQVLQDWIKTLFYADLRQGLVTAVGLALTLARLAALLLLLLAPTLAAYAWLLIACAAIASLVWIALARFKFQFTLRSDGQIFSTLRHALTDYGLWDHFNRMVVDTLFNIDVAILSLVGQRADIASYSIALRLTSLMMLVPRQLAASLQLALSQYRKTEKRADVTVTYLKASLILTLLQLGGILLLARPLVVILFGDDIDVERVTFFTRILAVAVAVFSLSSPLTGIINATGKVRRSFLQASLPALLFGLVCYFTAGARWGAVGMAYSNIAAYLLLVLALAWVVKRYSPLPLRFTWVSPREREFLRQWRGRH